jgi:hypothetical protein
MDNKLSRLDGTPTEDLRQISSAMQQYLNTENEATLNTAIEKLNQRPGLVQRLFPTAYQKEQQRIDIQRMRSIANSKEEMFRLYTEVQLEIAKKQGDALIASVGMHLQTKLTAFATERIDEISQTIGESRQRFMQRIKPQLSDLESYRDVPELYDQARQSVNQEIRIYFETIQKLLTGFVEALESRVASSRK